MVHLYINFNLIVCITVGMANILYISGVVFTPYLSKLPLLSTVYLLIRVIKVWLHHTILVKNFMLTSKPQQKQ